MGDPPAPRARMPEPGEVEGWRGDPRQDQRLPRAVGPCSRRGHPAPSARFGAFWARVRLDAAPCWQSAVCGDAEATDRCGCRSVAVAFVCCICALKRVRVFQFIAAAPGGQAVPSRSTHLRSNWTGRRTASAAALKSGPKGSAMPSAERYHRPSRRQPRLPGAVQDRAWVACGPTYLWPASHARKQSGRR